MQMLVYLISSVFVTVLGQQEKQEFDFSVHSSPSCLEFRASNQTIYGRGWFFDKQKCELCAHRHCICDEYDTCKNDQPYCFPNEYISNETESGYYPLSGKTYKICKVNPSCPDGCNKCYFKVGGVKESARCTSCKTGFIQVGHMCFQILKDSVEQVATMQSPKWEKELALYGISRLGSKDDGFECLREINKDKLDSCPSANRSKDNMRCEGCFPGAYLNLCQQCVKCMDNCKNCVNGNTCELCQPDYFWDSSSNTCAPKMKNCLTQNYPSICSACKDGFWLSETGDACNICSEAKTADICTNKNDKIKSKCQNYFFGKIQDSAADSCIKCNDTISNCDRCSKGTECSVCAVGYLLNSEQKNCTQCSTFCKTYVSGTTTCECATCPSGYMLRSKKCQPCDENVNGKQLCANCTIKDDVYKCVDCNVDLYPTKLSYNDMKCSDTCLLSNCAECTIKKVESTYANVCKKCSSGNLVLKEDQRFCDQGQTPANVLDNYYSLDSENKTNIIECISPSTFGNNIVMAQEKYPDYGFLRPPIMASNQKDLNNVDLSYTLYHRMERNGQSTCEKNPGRCREMVYSPKTLTPICSSCYKGWKLLEDVEGTTVVNADCLKCDPYCNETNCVIKNKTPSCVQCIQGFAWDEKAQRCSACNSTTFYGSFCTSCNNTACLTCKAGYFLMNSTICVSCPIGCIDCDPVNGCKKCDKGRYMSSTKKNECTSGIAKSCSDICPFVTKQNTVPNCMNYVGDGKCLDCVDTYAVNVNTLGDCKNFGSSPGCSKYQISNGNPVCVDCRDGFYYDDSSKLCQDCPVPNCIDCNADKCLNCTANYTLSSLGFCQPKNPYCLENDDSGVFRCKKCFEGWYLDLNSICQKNLINCLVMKSNGECETCIYGSHLQNGQCSKCIGFAEGKAKCPFD